MRLGHVLVLALFVLGCKGGGPPKPGEGSGVTFREVCREVGKSLCDKAAECTPPGDPQCASTFLDLCCQSVPDCDKDSGVSENVFEQCLDDIEHLSCDHADDLPPSCQ